MKIRYAKQLHSGDEVQIKRTGVIMRVIETEYVSKEQTANHIEALSVRLEDGNWYGHKEIK